jgi:hypothetical protein
MASGTITTGSNPKLLWPGLTDIWGLAYNEYQPQWEPLFEHYVSNKKYEEDVGLSGMGLAPVKDEGDALTYDTQKQSYVSRYTNVAYSIGFVITREEMADNQYPDVAPMRTRNIAFSMHQTKENVGANVFNRAFNNSYPGGDGKSLINSAHPTDGGTLSNTLAIAADLSEASIEQALIDISLFRDNRNNLISIQEKCLVVPPQLIFEAYRILKNPQRPGTTDRDISAMYLMGVLPEGIKRNQFLTDSDAWFILTNCPVGLKYFEREAPRLEDDNDFDTKNGKYSGYERYSFGWSDWRGIYGSPGA